MNDVQPGRGEKHTCQSCEARFYDLGRQPMICPKCGAEFIEVVRPPPALRQGRKKWPFGRDRVEPAAEIAEDDHPRADTDEADGEEPETDEEADHEEESEQADGDDTE